MERRSLLAGEVSSRVSAPRRVAGAALVVLGLCAVFAFVATNPSTVAGTDLASTCSRDTGGTCYTMDCYPWRKDATCSRGKCMCPSGLCAYQGTCLSTDEIPRTPPPPSSCEMRTGGTCVHESCYSWRNAECSGWTFSFTTGVQSPVCVCSKPGTCAVNGTCVSSPELTAPPPELNAKKIVCPVLASLYNAGFLVPDEYGRVERLKVQEAIRVGLNADDLTAWFFGQTTAGFTAADVDSTNFNMDPLSMSLDLLFNSPNATREPSPEDNRYLNIFTMGSTPAIIHQVAAAVRGGEGLVDPQCTSGYPCLARYEQFWEAYATPDGRLYAKQLGQALCNIFRNGFHGVATDNFFTLTQGFTAREYLAVSGWLIAFGRTDENGMVYLSVNDTRVMEMNGVFPPDWKLPPVWGVDQVLEVQNVWRKQGVCGLSMQTKGASLLKALTTNSPEVIKKAFDSP